MRTYIYVIDKDGNPLSPTYRQRKVRKLLKEKKARIFKYNPFTIQLLYEPKTHVVNTYICGNDPGRKNIGLSVINNYGEETYSAHITTRNEAIPSLMKERSVHRRDSRNGERKVRQRQAKRNNTTFIGDENLSQKDIPIQERILPKCNEPIKIKYIKNTEAKFHNRKKSEGWLTPTANQLLQTHINAVEQLLEILPITDFVLEINKFDFERLKNPNINPWKYGNGPLKGITLEELISEEQNHHCLLCKNSIEHYHHIIPQYKNGSDTVANMVGLCEKHHHQVHTNKKIEKCIKDKKEGLEKQFGSLSILNQIFKPFIHYLIDKFGVNHVFFTDGKATAQFRRNYNIQKTHEKDAYCIACSIINNPKIDCNCKTFEIKQFRKHNRQKNIARIDRKYYQIETETITKTFKNGKTVKKTKIKSKKLVATNRHKRCNQKNDSLRQYYMKLRQQYDKKTAKKIISELVVEKGHSKYRNPNTIMPGAVFIYKGKHYVLAGTCCQGKYFLAVGYGRQNFNVQKCKIVQKNKGLVYLY